MDKNKKQSNPDIYMPFQWPLFWSAVEGLADSIIVAYQRQLTVYWFHEHCRGLLNDELKLRRISRMEHSPDWAETKSILFDTGNYWVKKNGLWHQPRALQEWERAAEAMEMRRRQTYGANAARKEMIKAYTDRRRLLARDRSKVSE